MVGVTVAELEVQLSARIEKLKAGLAEAKDDLAAFERGAGVSGKRVEGMWDNHMRQVGEAAQQMGRSMTMWLTAPIAGAAAAAINMAGHFEQTLNVLQATSSATASQMEAVRKQAMALGADLTLPNVSAKTAAETMLELSKAGFTVEQAMAAAKGSIQLATAAQVDQVTAAGAVANAINAFGLEAKDATMIANAFAGAANASSASMPELMAAMQMTGSAAAALKVPFQETVAALGVLANNGIKGSDAGTSLKMMFQRLTAPTKDATAALKAAGISAFDAHGKFVGMDNLLLQLSTHLRNLSPKDKGAWMVKVFGQDAMRVGSIFATTRALADFRKEMAAVTKEGTAAALAGAQNKGFLGALDGLRSALESLMTGEGSRGLPVLTNAIRGLAQAVNGFADLPDPIKNTALALAGLVATVGPALVALGTVAQSITSISVLLGAAGVLAGAAPIILALAATVAAFALAWQNNWGDIQGKTTAVLEGIKQAWTEFTSTLMATWNEVKAELNGTDVFGGVSNDWQANYDAITQIEAWFGGFAELIKGAVRSLGAFASMWIHVLRGEWQAAADDAVRTGTSLTDSFSKAMDRYNEVVKKRQEAWDDGKLKMLEYERAMKALGKGGLVAFTAEIDRQSKATEVRLAEAGQTSAMAFSGGFEENAKRALPKFEEAGRQAALGFGKGLAEGHQKVTNDYLANLHALVSQAKSALGIKSPSRVFMTIGQQVAEGFRQGILSGIAGVGKAMEQMVLYFELANRMKGQIAAMKDAAGSALALHAGVEYGTLQSLSPDLQKNLGALAQLSVYTELAARTKARIAELQDSGRNALAQWIGTDLRTWKMLSAEMQKALTTLRFKEALLENRIAVGPHGFTSGLGKGVFGDVAPDAVGSGLSVLKQLGDQLTQLYARQSDSLGSYLQRLHEERDALLATNAETRLRISLQREAFSSSKGMLERAVAETKALWALQAQAEMIDVERRAVEQGFINMLGSVMDGLGSFVRNFVGIVRKMIAEVMREILMARFRQTLSHWLDGLFNVGKALQPAGGGGGWWSGLAAIPWASFAPRASNASTAQGQTAVSSSSGGGVLSALASIPWGSLFRADGGPVYAGRPYIVGERGPEVFVPGASGNVISNSQSSRSFHEGGSSVRNEGSRSSSAPIHIEIHFSSPDVEGFRRSQRAILGEAFDAARAARRRL